MAESRIDDDRLWASVLPVLSARKDDKGRIEGLGTAFVCGREGSSSLLLTCWHVVEKIGAENLRVMGQKVRIRASGDKALDLALLAVDDLPAVGFLPLAPSSGKPDLPFRTVGHFWADDDQDVPDSRPLDGRLGEVRRKFSSERVAVPGWEFHVVRGDRFDRIRAGYSGAPVLDAACGAVVAVISHQEGEDAGHAIDVSNLASIYPQAASLFRRVAEDEGRGQDPWIVKTLDHRAQMTPLCGHLACPGKPVVALVDGCADDLPKYLADHVLLEPWPELDEIPAEATALDPERYGDDDEAFWRAVHATLPRSQQSLEAARMRDIVRIWLGERRRHVFTLTLSIASGRRGIPRLIRGAQKFLDDLAGPDPRLCLLLLIVCHPSKQGTPWWWTLWRRYRLDRMQGVVRLEPLAALDGTDIGRWPDGFSDDARRTYNSMQLVANLLELCDEHPAGVRYRLLRRRLLDGGALDGARVEP